MLTLGQFRDVLVRARKQGAGLVGGAWIFVVSFAMLVKEWVAPTLPIPLLLAPRRMFWVRDRAQLWNLDEVWLQNEYDRFAGEPDVVLDLGANVGSSSTWFAWRYPRARIISVEADPLNVELLRRNVAAYPQITVVAGAVAAEAGTVGIERAQYSWLTRVSGDGDVPAYALADLLTGVEGPAAVKMDIEGSEWAVLPTIDKRISEVYGEWHADPAVPDPEAELAAVASAVGMRSVPAEKERFHWLRDPSVERAARGR